MKFETKAEAEGIKEKEILRLLFFSKKKKHIGKEEELFFFRRKIKQKINATWAF